MLTGRHLNKLINKLIQRWALPKEFYHWMMKSSGDPGSLSWNALKA
jgi:hypothetical protein